MKKKLYSQKMREIAVEMDALKMGMKWSYEDLSKIQIMLSSTMGDSHPGSICLYDLVSRTETELYKLGAKGAKMTVTDICDGIAQGHDGMNYSLVSREIITDMIEIQGKATPYDGIIFFSSCDKGIPGQLKAMARLNMPSVFVPGGVMIAGEKMLTLEQIGTYNAQYKRNEITKEELINYQKKACPSCGACSFMGTAATMQIISESLGLALPGSALIPTVIDEYKNLSEEVSLQIVNLVNSDLRPKNILTREAFENAIMVHAAIGGSTNALLHIPAIAFEVDIDIDALLFDQINRKIPFIVNVKPSGTFPAEFFYYAGGVGAVMEEIKDYLHLDVMTVTGKTLGENLEDQKKTCFYEKCNQYLKEKQILKKDIIFSCKKPIKKEGSISILKGSIAPEGSVVKHSSIDEKMRNVILRAKTFNCEEDAFSAVISKQIRPGDAVIIRYEGPKATGMPEMFYTTEAIASDPELFASTALITDGRFSGATRGPAIGHVSPEAIECGTIALIENDDLIQIDIDMRIIDLVGVNSKIMDKSEIDNVIAKRKLEWKKPEHLYKKGVLSVYTQLAVSSIKGGYIKV